MSEYSNFKQAPLSDEKMQQLVPSAFAVEPWERMSHKYRMIPTIEVINKLREHGFVPMQATQGRTRIPGKKFYTRHLIRFGNPTVAPEAVGDVIPQIALVNSHDGTSAYKVYLAMLKVLCMNGMMIDSGRISEVSVTHRGPETLAEDVLDASFRVIEQAPTAIAQIEDWSQRKLERKHQLAYAEAALELSDHSLKPSPEQLIVPRRYQDSPSDLWHTMNVVQENMMKGGQRTVNANGARRHVRAIKSVNEDMRFNRALWKLTEAMADKLSA